MQTRWEVIVYTQHFFLKGKANLKQEYDLHYRSFETINFGTSFIEIDA